MVAFIAIENGADQRLMAPDKFGEVVHRAISNSCQQLRIVIHLRCQATIKGPPCSICIGSQAGGLIRFGVWLLIYSAGRHAKHELQTHCGAHRLPGGQPLAEAIDGAVQEVIYLRLELLDLLALVGRQDGADSAIQLKALDGQVSLDGCDLGGCGADGSFSGPGALNRVAQSHTGIMELGDQALDGLNLALQLRFDLRDLFIGQTKLFLGALQPLLTGGGAEPPRVRPLET